MAWFTTPFLLAIACLPFYALFSDDLFCRVWSFVTLVFIVSLTPVYYWPSSAAAVLGLIVAIPAALLWVALSPLQFIWNRPCTRDKRNRLNILDRGPTEQPKPQQSSQSELLQADIVAVHGLASSPKTTWLGRRAANTPMQNPSSQQDPFAFKGHPSGSNIPAEGSNAGSQKQADSIHPNWLRDFLPKEGLKARVIAFNHDTQWKRASLSKSPEDYGKELLYSLRGVREKDEEIKRPIILIGHSFGGLIIKQAFVTAAQDRDHTFHSNIYDRIIGFVFLGTPHRGAKFTFFGRILSLFGYWQGSSTTLLEFMKPGSKLNEKLHKDFMGVLTTRQKVLCVREALPEMFWGFNLTEVVSPESAVIDGAEEAVFDTPHRELQRFSTYRDDDYRTLVTWMSDVINHNASKLRVHCPGPGEITISSDLDPFQGPRGQSRILPSGVDPTRSESHQESREHLPDRKRPGPGEPTGYTQPSSTQLRQYGTETNRGCAVEFGYTPLVAPHDRQAESHPKSSSLASRDVNGSQRMPVSLFEWIDGFSVLFSIDDTPNSGRQFVPREKEMQLLENCLLPERGNSNKRKVCVLHGVGGMGKTRLAIEFAKKHTDKFDSIFFINGKDLTTLTQSFSRLLGQITKSGLPGQPGREVDADAPTKAKEWFCLNGNTRWLIIFDNVDTEASSKGGYDVRSYFPRLSRGSILITTRLAGLATLGDEKRVPKMNDAQAGQLLTNVLKLSRRYYNMDIFQTSSKSDAEKLLKLLDGLPLAIIQAGGYIVDTGTSIKDYIDSYYDSKPKLMEYMPYSIEDRNCCIRTTWTMSFGQIEKKGRTNRDYLNASKLLRLWAYLDARDLSYDLLKKGDQGPGIPRWYTEMLESKFDFRQAIGVLLNFSLADCTLGQDSYWMHRILHDWCSLFLPKDVDGEFLALAIRAIGYSTPVWSQQDSDEVERKLLVHADVMYNHIVRNVPSIPPWEDFSVESDCGWDTRQLEHPLRLMARLYLNQGKLEKAEGLIHPLIDSLTREHGVEYELTVLFEVELAWIQYEQEQFTDAEIHADHVYQRFNEIRGPTYPHALTALNILGALYEKTNRAEKAITTYRELVDLSSAALGRLNYRTLIFLDNLGLTLMNIGYLDESERCFEDSLTRRKSKYKSEHFRTIEAINRLAETCKMKAELEKAEKLHREAWELTQKVYGARHSQTIDAQDRLAADLHQLGRAHESVDLTVKAIENIEEGTGSLFANIWFNLGIRYRKISDLTGAETALKKALELWAGVQGAEGDIIDTREQLLSIYKESNKVEEMEQQVAAMVLSFPQSSNRDAERVLDMMASLAKMLFDGGDFEKSRLWYEKAAPKFELLLGEYHWSTLSLLGSYAVCLLRMDEQSQAESTFRRILPLFEHTFGRRDQLTLSVLGGLASTLLNKDVSEAIRLYERVLFISLGQRPLEKNERNEILDLLALGQLYRKRARLGESEFVLRTAMSKLLSQTPQSLEIIEVLNNLGIVCLMWGEYEKARRHFEAALNTDAGSPDSNEETDQGRLIAMDELGIVFERQHRLKEAEDLVEKAASGFELEYGPENQDALLAMNNLARISASLGKVEQTTSLLLRLSFSLKEPRNRSVTDVLDEIWKQCGRLLFEEDADKWLALAITACTKFIGGHNKVTAVAKEILVRLRALNARARVQPHYLATAPMAECELGYVHLYLMLFWGECNMGSCEDGECHQKALLLAAGNGHMEIIQAILRCHTLDLDWEGSLESCKFLPSGLEIFKEGTGPFPSTYTALFAAASQGQVETARLLIQKGASAKRQSTEGWTPLHGAARSGSESTVRLLLGEGASATASTKDGWSVLHAAAHRGHQQIVEALIDSGADGAAVFSQSKVTPLHIAAKYGREGAVQKLMQNKLVLDAADIDDWTALHYAAFNGHVILAEMLANQGASLNAYSRLGRTPLTLACSAGFPMVAYVLIEKIKKNKSGNQPSWEALRAAAAAGHETIVRLLLDSGADINTADEHGSTALHAAARNGHNLVVQVLIQHLGASPDIHQAKSGTSLASEQTDDLHGLPPMLEHDAIDRPDLYGATALHLAAHSGSCDTVRLLLNYGANAKAVDIRKSSALHFAAGSGDGDVIRLLATRGCDVNATNVRGQSPLHIAASGGKAAVVEELLNLGAYAMYDFCGWTPANLVPNDCPLLRKQLVSVPLHGSTVQPREPTAWCSEDKSPHLVVDPSGFELELPTHFRRQHIRLDQGTNILDYGFSARSNYSIPHHIQEYYFEVKILKDGSKGFISIGLSDDQFELDNLAGWCSRSWGYHGDDGTARDGLNMRDRYGPNYSAGDTVGCGIVLETGEIYFTKNRIFLGTAFHNVYGQLFPTVGLAWPGTQVRATFGLSPPARPSH